MTSSNVASPGALIFKPEPSNGGKHMAVLAAIMSVLLLAPLVAGLILLRDYWYVFLVLIIGALAVGWFLLRYALYFPICNTRSRKMGCTCATAHCFTTTSLMPT
ncbi:MAG TPA: hypothetical protein VGE45_13350 [Chloroflexia bacterium]|jgi:hypothetical protein